MLAPSMLNGIFDGLRDWIIGFFSLIPKAMYLLITMILSILDIFQTLFRKIVGIETVYFINENGISTPVGGEGNDIVLTLLNNSVIRDAIYAMIALSIVLLFVFTIIAILRTEYNAEDAKSASKGKVIGKSLKALGMFFLVPVLCYMGLFLSNFLLITLDKATAQLPTSLSSESLEVFEPGYYFDLFGTPVETTSTPLSGMAFRAASYRANRIRSDEAFANALAFDGETDGTGITFGKTFMPTGTNSTDEISGRDIAANLLDDAFANSYKLKDGKTLSINGRIAKITDADAKAYLQSFAKTVILEEGDNDRDVTLMSKFRVNLVWFFYDLWQYDFVLGLGVVIVMTIIILNITLAVMKRVFDIIILTIIAPPIAATLPLDNGEAFKKWRVKYVSKAIQAYGPVVAMNLFFMIVPFINDFSFIGVTNGGVYTPIAAADYLIQAFFVIVGLVAVKDISKTLADLVGSEDAIEAGGKMSGEVTGTALKTASLMSKGVAVGAGVFAAPVKAIGTRMFAGGKAGNAARDAYEAKHKDDANYNKKDAINAGRQARVADAKQKAQKSFANSIGSTVRGSVDLVQGFGKNAFAGTDYAKAVDAAGKGGYGVADIMKNITAGASADFKGINIAGSDKKYNLFVGKNEKELIKQTKEEDIKYRAKKAVKEKYEKAESAEKPAAKPATAGSKVPASASADATESKFGTEKALKADGRLDNYFSKLNAKSGDLGKVEYKLDEVQKAHDELLQQFKDDYNKRSAKGGRFDEQAYTDKIHTEVKHYMTEHGLKQV